jgi:hypothetical protein
MGMMAMSALSAMMLFTWLICSAQAETYRWTDDAGVIHFADDYDKIPSRYRQKVTIENDMSGVNVMPSSGAAGRATAEPAAAAESSAVTAGQKTGTKKLKKGKKNARVWSVKKKSKLKTTPVATTPARDAQNQAEERIRKDRKAIDDAQQPARRDQVEAEEQIRKSREGAMGH